MTLNTIDGVIAIERGNLRLKGEIVNALPDRYSDIFVLIGIALSPMCTPLLGMLGMASMFLVSYTGMLYLRLTGKIGDFYTLTYFEWLMILFIILGQVTVFNRLKAQLKECKKLDWIKYRNIDKKIIVIYDTLTGNTEKAAKEAAEALECKKHY